MTFATASVPSSPTRQSLYRTVRCLLILFTWSGTYGRVYSFDSQISLISATDDLPSPIDVASDDLAQVDDASIEFNAPDHFAPDDEQSCAPFHYSDHHSGNNLSWIDAVQVGYDDAFVIGSSRQNTAAADGYPFQLRINGWGQLRSTTLDSSGPNRDVNQFQLKRGRLIFSGSAYTRDFMYLIQLDGRSGSGDNMRLLDFYLTYDIGHHVAGLERGAFGFKTGKYKMPFTGARHLSGKQFQFADRSMASTFFDVNRSLAWGLFGRFDGFWIPLHWETAIFNGLVTGGAETGSSGDLDDNFAYATRLYAYPQGDWGTADLADLEWHNDLATRIGAGFARSTINRSGSTEFNALLVVDSGNTLNSLLPAIVNQYDVKLFSVDASAKFRGWSSTLEYYFRTIDDFRGASVATLFDHGFWLQLGKFVVPGKLELLARWSRVTGNSGTLGGGNQSAEEISGGFVWYFRDQHAKLTADATYLDGAPIDSTALGITPGERGWLYRTQIQFAF